MAIPVVTGDKIRITLRGHFSATVQTLNVFHYKVDPTDALYGGDNLGNAAASFWYAFKDVIRPPTSNVQRYESVTAESLDLATWNVINGEEYAIPGGEQYGTATGDCLPPYSTWSFRYVRASADFRHGYKRFPGIPEGGQVNGYAEAGYITYMNAIATLLNGDIVFAALGSHLLSSGRLKPQLYKAHRYGGDVRPVEFQRPASVVYEGIGSQNTRKYGRGS